MPTKRSHLRPSEDRKEYPVADLQSPELAPYWLAAIIESADDAIISKTLEGIITSWNKGAARIFGYTADEVIGKSVTILIPEGHLDEEPAILARLRAGQRIEHYETVRIRKDRELIDISLTVSPIRGPNGEIVGASKIARDITEQKQSRRALDEASERLRLALDAARLGAWSWDARTDVVTMSETAERIFGISPGTHLTRPAMRQLVHEDDRERARGLAEEALAQHKDFEVEYRVRRADGSEVWVLAKARGIFAEDESLAGTLGFVQDISARKRNEEALREQAETLRTLNEAAKKARAEAEQAAAQNERLYRQA